MKRRHFIAALGVAGAGTVCGAEALVWEPTRLTVTKHTLGPGGGRRLRIVQLTDLHLQSVGPFQNEIARAVDVLEPDLVVFTGDTIDRVDRLDVLEAFLASFAFETRRIAILGNWERWVFDDIEPVRLAFANRGTRLLVNESETIEHRGAEVTITGLDDLVEGASDYETAMRGITHAPNHLLLVHCPAFRDALHTPRPPDLMLSGHTHGGQIQILGYAPWLPVGSGRYLEGWYREGSGVPLYVSRGLGTVSLPARFGAPPEIAVFDWSLA